MDRREPLVLQHMESVASSALEKYQHIIRDYVRNKHGIYALYRRGRLYYVGLASNLRGRLNSHLRDRHKGLWDTFSIYLTINNRHMKELESLAIRIAMPGGNRQKGGFARSENLLRRFRHDMHQQALREIDAVFGRFRPRRRVRPGRRKLDGGARPELYGFSPRAIDLRADYKGKPFKARVLKNGMIRYRTRSYKTLREAAVAARGRPTNGWYFWKARNKKRQWVRIRDYRG